MKTETLSKLIGQICEQPPGFYEDVTQLMFIHFMENIPGHVVIF